MGSIDMLNKGISKYGNQGMHNDHDHEEGHSNHHIDEDHGHHNSDHEHHGGDHDHYDDDHDHHEVNHGHHGHNDHDQHGHDHSHDHNDELNSSEGADLENEINNIYRLLDDDHHEIEEPNNSE